MPHNLSLRHKVLLQIACLFLTNSVELKYIQFTIIYDKGKLQILTFEKAGSSYLYVI